MGKVNQKVKSSKNISNQNKNSTKKFSFSLKSKTGSKSGSKDASKEKISKKDKQEKISLENSLKIKEQQKLLKKFANEISSDEDDEYNTNDIGDESMDDEFNDEDILELEKKYSAALESANENENSNNNIDSKNSKTFINDNASINRTQQNLGSKKSEKKIFEFSNTTKRKFVKSLEYILNTEIPPVDERYQSIDEELKAHISPQFILLCKAKKPELKWIEDALKEIHASKKKSSRSRETNILQQLNYTEVTHLTFEKEAKLLKTAQAGIVKLLNAVAAVKKDKIEKEIQDKERAEAHIEGDKVYEILKKDRYDYRLPDSVKILHKPL